MKHYTAIATIGLAVFALIAWRGCRNTSGEDPSHVPSRHPTRSSENTGAWRAKDPETPEEYEALVRKKSIEAAKRNNAPIAFYGRVVDQDGQPLQGVAVGYTTTAIPAIPVPWGPIEKESGSCVTDQNGVFSIEGKHGVSFGVNSLRKSGYRESGYYQQGHVRYEPYEPQRHIPVRSKPVVFMLIRDDMPKAQEVFNQRLRFNWNADALIQDLGPGIGKLEIIANRTGWDASNARKKFEWEVKIRAIGFTLVKLPNEGVRVAPPEGYRSDTREGYSPDEKAWTSNVRGSYAIKTNGGAYGLMDLTLYANRDDGGVGGRATVYLNKSGARNLDHP